MNWLKVARFPLIGSLQPYRNPPRKSKYGCRSNPVRGLLDKRGRRNKKRSRRGVQTAKKSKKKKKNPPESEFRNIQSSGKKQQNRIVRATITDTNGNERKRTRKRGASRNGALANYHWEIDSFDFPSCKTFRNRIHTNNASPSNFPTSCVRKTVFEKYNRYLGVVASSSLSWCNGLVY